jgi:hypothetical protein
MRVLLLVVACCAVAVAAHGGGEKQTPLSPYPVRLSEFGLFEGRVQKPGARLIPYALKTPLFSDYADKQRYMVLPSGKKPSISPVDGRLEFPVGTILVKNFGYPDARGKLKILETRLLVRTEDEWVALPYVWRADGSDADLKLAGARIPVDTVLADGRSIKISYAVPNKNQCKLCHGEAGLVVPIGPRMGNINAPDLPFLSSGGQAFGSLDWRSNTQAKLADRARSYLDINCAHCHNPKGSASNSGLYLSRDIQELVKLGIGKRPVAAGRGAGDFAFVIEPGHPERSILIHRMKSIEAGIAMPELGRATVDAEGVKLLEDWIRGMKTSG